MAYIGNVPAEKYTALTQQTFSSPTGTSFTLSQAVTNPVDIDLYIDNVKQNPASYSVSGTSLTTSTISSPSTMYCIFNGRATETVNPPDDSVGLSQIASATDGNLISFDASGNPAYVATGNDGQVLTSAGAGAAPAFEAILTNAKAVSSSYNVATASGTQDVTGFGFNPRFVIGFGSIEGTDSTFMGWTEVGVLDRSTAEDGATGNSYAYGSFPVGVVTQSGTKAAGVVSSISDGIRITWTKTGSPTGTLQLYLLGYA